MVARGIVVGIGAIEGTRIGIGVQTGITGARIGSCRVKVASNKVKVGERRCRRRRPLLLLLPHLLRPHRLRPRLRRLHQRMATMPIKNAMVSPKQTVKAV